MTATHAAAARTVSSSPGPSPNWTAVGVIVAAAVHAAAAVAFAASLDRRVANIEAQVPAGAIARLDERTVQMQATLRRLEERR